MLDKNIDAFLTLVRAGLWETDARIAQYKDISFNEIYRLAEEQSVVGLVAAGIEHVIDLKLPQEVSLQFAGQTLQLEQRNTAMNNFISVIVDKMRDSGIYTLLVKGQGIAQCYERPLWRSSGDVDFLLDLNNYQQAIVFLSSLATSIDEEQEGPHHQAMMIDSWEVELHGTLHSGLYPKFDKTLDAIQNQVFEKEYVRTWRDGVVDVFLPRADEDVVFVFAHILQHFFKVGIGLRQICDWSRLMFTFKDSLNRELLECRIRKMGLMSEWKVFGVLAVDFLGMPVESMPLYSSSIKWKHKADRVLDNIIETGNFGHNKVNRYFEIKSLLGRKSYSFWMHTSDGIKHLFIFPKDSFLIWLNMVKTGLRAIIKYQ